MIIQGYETKTEAVLIGARTLPLIKVKNLEGLVDREALLSDDSEEPPYWAHLWTGSITLVRYLDSRVLLQGENVLDLGCGLGLVGVMAALKGGNVTFADKEREALAFARQSASLNECLNTQTTLVDFTVSNLRRRFSIILGAEVLYDRPTFPQIILFLRRHLEIGGRAIFADAHRTNTDEFYHALDQTDFEWTKEQFNEVEEGIPLKVDIVIVRHSDRGNTYHW